MQTMRGSVFPKDGAIIELGCEPALGIGFRRGHIEYFDGANYRPVSLKQSVQLYILLVMRPATGEGACKESCATTAYLRWLRLIARRLK
jgi:hypothetical protein